MLALHLGTVATLLLIINNVAISRLHLVLTYTLFWGLATLIRRVNRLSAQSTM